MIKAILAVLVGVVVMIVVMNTVDKMSLTDNTTDTTEKTEENTMSVSISGEINKSGTYYINAGGTLGDLITAAGGATNNADSNAYNLDYTLSKNMSFYIAPIYNSGDTCSQTPIEKVNINTATSEEILAVKGFTITSNVANNIVSYRAEKGSFKRIEDLKEVSYIGTATFEKMKNYVTLKWYFYSFF